MDPESVRSRALKMLEMADEYLETVLLQALARREQIARAKGLLLDRAPWGELPTGGAADLLDAVGSAGRYLARYDILATLSHEAELDDAPVSGAEFEVNDWISSPADGGDVGRVTAVVGKNITVAWQSGVTTTQPAEALTESGAVLHTERPH